MCGLVSIISRKQSGFMGRDVDLFEQMLIIDTFRGKDSTGVMSTFKNKDVQVVKLATQPFLLFETQQWKDLRHKVIQTGRYMAGHNRAATKGAVNNDNAHPFVEDNIILMHNGTLTNHETLTKNKVEVDSNAIAHALVEATPQEVLPKVWGAFALIWYDTKTEKLYATRNDERPLSLITTDDFYFLTSEPWMAAMPAQRQGRKIESIIDIPPGTLLEFDMFGNLKESVLPKRYPSSDSERYQHWMAGHHGGKFTDWERDVVAADEKDTLGSATKSSLTNDDNVAEAVGGTSIIPFKHGSAAPTSPRNIRQALTKAAKDKAEKEGSTSCALLSQGARDMNSPSPDNQPMTTTSSASTTNSTEAVVREMERIETNQRGIVTPLTGFPKASTQWVKIHSIDQLPNGRIKWAGKIRTVDRELLDCQGFLEDDIPSKEWPHWIDTICWGFVAWTTYTIGGPSVWIRDVERCLYTDVHGADIPIAFWTHAVNQCKCGKCGNHIEPWERTFTHVKMKASIKSGHQAPLNELTVTCAECLLKVLPDGEIYDQFSTKYFKTKNAIYTARVSRHKALEDAATADCATPVSDRKFISEEPIGKNGSTLVVQGPATLQ